MPACYVITNQEGEWRALGGLAQLHRGETAWSMVHAYRDAGVPAYLTSSLFVACDLLSGNVLAQDWARRQEGWMSDQFEALRQAKLVELERKGGFMHLAYPVRI